ncbi:MAG: MG2 domain-containing protein [Methylococcaceae bacterium]|nr:MG2 domain-containing protein [Methylococcaceae bacterium]
MNKAASGSPFLWILSFGDAKESIAVVGPRTDINKTVAVATQNPNSLTAIISHLILLTTLLIPLSANAGSPFYLTAERSFSNTESPNIRLDYTLTDQPMMIRVLKANNLETFLDGQFNVSRSYEQPVSELNPGHYFAKGLNAAQSPLKLFRGMLDVEFRKSLKETNFGGSVLTVTEKPLVSVPQQILVAPPSGFQVVKENYLDLQHNGQTTQDLGWWFGQDTWSEQRYKTRQIALEPLPDGIYLLQAVQGKTEAQCLIQVSSLSIQIKQSSEQLLVRAINRDLQPVANAKVSYRDGRGRWQAVPEATNAAGELSFKNPEGVLDGKLLVRVDAPAAKPGEAVRTALTATDFLPTQAKDDSVFVLTDRPIFKPGETFYYKGIVRNLQDGQLKIPAFQSRQTDVSLIRADGNATGLQGQTALTDFGSFSGSFDLDPGQTPGLYRLLAEIDHKAYGGEFRVRDYIKPTFYLEWLDRSPVVQAGQPFNLKFRAKRYSGGVPQNVKFEVFLYRKKFEAPQFVMEAGAGLAAGNDYFGAVKSAAPLTQPQRLFSSIEERQAAELSNPWETAAKLDDNGDGSFEFTVPAGDKEKADQEWIYTLMVRAQDQSGGMAILTDNLYATLSEAQPALSFNKTVAAVGDQDLQLLLQSNYSDGKPAPKAGGVVDVMLEQPGTAKRNLVKLDFATDERGQQRLTIPALKEFGRLTAVARLETLDGRSLNHPASSQPSTLIVAGSGGEAVADNPELELYTPTTILSPGEQAKVFALLPKAWGNNESGPVWETVAGSRLFDSRGSQMQGRSRWFEVTAKPEYGTGFYHTVTVPVAGGKYKEQTLGFRIVPKEKRLQIAIQPEKAETEPLKPTKVKLEVKRADGSPSANTELAVSIVDRAVYAVQAEFRPGIFDFFYPLQRSNLSTYYSDDLQGYGYADLLRKPNFALNALKSQSKLAKKAMRDTAGWFPHVITDADGIATIDVEMPANITEWLVTAVASDKDGRIGETTGQFRSVTDVAVDMVGPQFLRQGDEVELAVKLTNHLAEPVKLAGNIGLPDTLQLQSGEIAPKAEMAGKAEQLWPLHLTTNGSQGTAAFKVGLSAPANVRVGGAEEFEIPLKAAALPQVYSSSQQDNLLRIDLPAEATPRQVSVRVNSGLLGASLQAAAMLVQYPYGCTEQLAHSTVPNLVLLDLIERAGLKPEQLGPLENTLKRAKQNAALGIRKLIQNQKADGGFSLWPGDSEASLPVSLIAMQALKYANDLQLEGVNSAYYKGTEWLATQANGNIPLDGFALAGFALTGTGYQSPWQQQADFVAKVAGDANAGTADLVAALRIFMAYEKQSWHSFNQQFKDQPQLKTNLAKRLQQALEAIDPANYQQNRGELYKQLGFGFGLPSLISSGLGTLNDAQALPPELETKLKRWLLQTQKNGYWTSTYDTAQVIFNSRELLSKEAATAGKQKARTLTASTKNGFALGNLARIPGGYLGNFSQFGDSPDLSEIRIGELNADEIASATVAVEVPYQAVAARAAGLDVQRSFRRITAKGSELFDMSQALKPGDVVVSEVRVKRTADAGRPAPGSEFVVIEDGIPSLAEGQENDQTYLADAKIQPKEDSYWANIKETQRFPDRIVRVAKLQPQGELTLYQVWRVTRPGNAAIPPATGFDMYNEAVQGNTSSARVSVVK